MGGGYQQIAPGIEVRMWPENGLENDPETGLDCGGDGPKGGGKMSIG